MARAADVRSTRLATARVSLDYEFEPIANDKRLDPAFLRVGNVNKDVGVAGVGANESVALRRVEQND